MNPLRLFKYLIVKTGFKYLLRKPNFVKGDHVVFRHPETELFAENNIGIVLKCINNKNEPIHYIVKVQCKNGNTYILTPFENELYFDIHVVVINSKLDSPDGEKI